MLLMFTLLTYLRRAWTNFGGVRTLSLIGKPTYPEPETDRSVLSV